MSRLIRANFSRLFNSIFFRVCVIFSAGFGILLDIMRYIDIRKNAELYADLGIEFHSADGFVFSGAIYIIFAAAAFVGAFVGTEYSDGTIRNKLMIGHKRTEIYLANFVVGVVADIIMLLAFILPTLGLGRILLGKLFLTFNQITLFTLIQCVTMISFTAILILLSMLIQNKSAGSVTALIMTVIMLFAAMTIPNKLNEPEYYEEYSYLDEETNEIITEPAKKNSRYLSGTKRKVYEFLDNALPVNQFYQIAIAREENINIMALYSVIIIVLANGAGIILFRKKDLK